MFPKIRSWLALGAPLELLSPLSVMRGVYVLAAVVWPLVVLAGGLSDFRGGVLPGVTAALLVTAVALVPAHQIG
ncbi:MAG: hypothetical protein ACRDZY_21355, partial [Acidimicrobiales bacterium]